MKKITQIVNMSLTISILMIPVFAAADSNENLPKGTPVRFTREFKTLDLSTQPRIISPGLGGLVMQTDETGNPTLIRIIGCLSRYNEECTVRTGKGDRDSMTRGHLRSPQAKSASHSSGNFTNGTPADAKGSDISALYRLDQEANRKFLRAELRLTRIQVEKERKEQLVREETNSAQPVEYEYDVLEYIPGF